MLGKLPGAIYRDAFRRLQHHWFKVSSPTYEHNFFLRSGTRNETFFDSQETTGNILKMNTVFFLNSIAWGLLPKTLLSFTFPSHFHSWLPAVIYLFHFISPVSLSDNCIVQFCNVNTRSSLLSLYQHLEIIFSEFPAASQKGATWQTPTVWSRLRLVFVSL